MRLIFFILFFLSPYRGGPFYSSIQTHASANHRKECGQQCQHFRSSPIDQEVIEGSVTVLKCEVGHQAGRVQWAKDGFVLGFNRSIPGYPRYEMIGDGVEGEHHLKIHNTTLVDDADYQCQVGPTHGHPPIRATGHLTVLMAPTSVELVDRGGEGEIEVVEGEEMTLKCRVEESKPPATVKWYKNDQELYLDTQIDTTEESKNHKRHNLISKITVRLGPPDDGSHFSCRAQHPALIVPKIASVKISVLYPPGKPQISGYRNGEALQSGEKRTLSCISRGGNPLGSVAWFRNNENLDSTDAKGSGQSVNDYSFIVDSEDNEAVYTCEVRNKLTEKPLLSSVKLMVQFAPKQVEITGAGQSRVGDNVTLTCMAQNSNPPAKISWVVDGQPRTETGHRKERVGNGGGWDTISKLDLNIPEVDRDIMVTCHATNPALGETKLDTYKLSVLRPPQAPILHGYSEGNGIPVGIRQRITCVSRGGNPPADLQWYRNGIKIPSKKHSIDHVSSAEIEIVAEAQDNHAQFRCEATNSASSTPISVSTTLLVHFPPHSVKITQAPRILKAGSQARLTCTAGASNPPATITWLRGDYHMLGRVQDTSEGPYGGTSVSNVLTLNLTATDDGLTYVCLASNTALQKDVRQAHTLRVNYAPTFLNEPPEIVDIILGDSEVLNLTAKSNPGPVQYEWTRNGLVLPGPITGDNWRQRDSSLDHGPGRTNEPVRGSVVFGDGPYLFVRRVTLDNAGEYQLEATNQEGSTIAKVYINVQYSASIKYTSGELIVSDGQDAVLECAADGNPLNEQMIKWKRNNYDFTKTHHNFSGKKSSLTVQRASKNDTGVFTCMVDNGVGLSAQANLTLIIKTKPHVHHSQLLNRAAAKEGGTGKLSCWAEGAPHVSFSWKKNGILLIPNSRRSQKYENQTTKTGLVSWSSTLYIHSVTKDDYDQYVCVAENDLGASTLTIHFTPPTVPDPPIALKIVNVTHDSVTLSWQPGFDGGLPQYYRIRFRPKTSYTYQLVDIAESYATSHTVSGLELATEYLFSIQSVNDEGESDYRGGYVRAKTKEEAPPTPSSSSNIGKENLKLPGLWIVIIVLVATGLLALNLSAIICIVKRRRKRLPHSAKKSPPTASSILASSIPKSVSRTQSRDIKILKESEMLLNHVLDERSDLTQGIITVVAIVGCIVIIVNVILVICLVKRKRSNRINECSDHLSNKSISNTIYAPSSYNDTVIGDTLSSISEKSRESYAHEDSLADYEEHTHKHAASTYLIEHIDPPPEYASQEPNINTPQTTAAFSSRGDDYAEVLRRNAYNHQLGKIPPGPPSEGDPYNNCQDSRVFPSFSYTSSPTGIPNGAVQYHSRGPNVTLGIHERPLYPDQISYTPDSGTLKRAGFSGLTHTNDLSGHEHEIQNPNILAENSHGPSEHSHIISEHPQVDELQNTVNEHTNTLTKRKNTPQEHSPHTLGPQTLEHTLNEHTNTLTKRKNTPQEHTLNENTNTLTKRKNTAQEHSPHTLNEHTNTLPKRTRKTTPQEHSPHTLEHTNTLTKRKNTPQEHSPHTLEHTLALQTLDALQLEPLEHTNTLNPLHTLNPHALKNQEHPQTLPNVGLGENPTMGPEQHSTHEGPGSVDLHSISVDHSVVAMRDFSNRNGDLRVVPPPKTPPTTTTLSTFHPNSGPTAFSDNNIDGHLV